MTNEFDQYANNYETLLNKALEVTGFDSQFLVSLRLQKLHRICPELGKEPANFLDFGCGDGRLYAKFQSYFPKVR